MFELRNIVIYIISQEDWGEMFISKHHYAVELSKRGNKVFFINHPDQNHKLNRGEVRIEKTQYPDLYVVKHRMWIPYFLKYDYPKVYAFLVRFHMAYLARKIKFKPDLVWSFDLSNSLPFVGFNQAKRTLFMPVDTPHWEYSIQAANGAQVILSVTQEILDKYTSFDVPRIFVNHGVSEAFVSQHIQTHSNHPIRVGYSGGLLRNEIDRPILLDLIARNPEIQFEFWGEHDFDNAFISVAKNHDVATVKFIESLKSHSNVVLHGVVHSSKLSQVLKQVDVLLTCYDINKDQSGGTNYHKLLEYLATGKVVVSTNVSTYSRLYPGYLNMLETRENNHGMAELFETVVSHLDVYNSVENQQKRIAFAKQFLYSNQVNKIEEILANLSPRH